MPEAARLHVQSAFEYLDAGRCSAAEDRCRLALEYGPKWVEAHNCLGVIAIRCTGDLKVAAGHFKDALALNADFAEGHNNLGMVFFRQSLPDYAAACDEFAAALEIDPAYVDARENYGECLLRQGTVLGEQGHLERRAELYAAARSQLSRLLELAPGRTAALHGLGFMDLTEHRLDSAREELQRCLAIDPSRADCSFALGNVYLEGARCDLAIEAYVGALRGSEETDISAPARQNLAVAHDLCARKDAAILTFLEQIRREPANALHHFDLGNIYAEKGLPDAAATEWENTVKLDAKYCPAYLKLAARANANFDTPATVERCVDFIQCAAESNRGRAEKLWGEDVAWCKGLLRRLVAE